MRDGSVTGRDLELTATPFGGARARSGYESVATVENGGAEALLVSTGEGADEAGDSRDLPDECDR